MDWWLVLNIATGIIASILTITFPTGLIVFWPEFKATWYANEPSINKVFIPVVYILLAVLLPIILLEEYCNS